MSDLDKKRDYLIGLYPNRKWRRRVLKMADNQVIAIYLNEKKREAERAEKAKDKEQEKPDDEIPF